MDKIRKRMRRLGAIRRAGGGTRTIYTAGIFAATSFGHEVTGLNDSQLATAQQQYLKIAGPKMRHQKQESEPPPDRGSDVEASPRTCICLVFNSVGCRYQTSPRSCLPAFAPREG